MLRIANNVGRITLFKDNHFLATLKNKGGAYAKHAIVIKFQNALEQINMNQADLRILRNQLNSNSLIASAKAADCLGTIISRLDEINATYNDAPVLKIDPRTPQTREVDACLAAIAAIQGDIELLENQVESLNRITSTMLKEYLNRIKLLRAQLKQN